MAQTITVVKNNDERLVIVSSKKKISRNQITAIFNIIEKSPSVKNFRGRVSKFKTGLIKKLIKPKIPPTTIKMCQYSVRLNPKKLLSGRISNPTPAINLTAKNIARTPAAICQNSFSMFYYYTLSVNQGKSLTRVGVLIKMNDN